MLHQNSDCYILDERDSRIPSFRENQLTACQTVLQHPGSARFRIQYNISLLWGKITGWAAVHRTPISYTSTPSESLVSPRE